MKKFYQDSGNASRFYLEEDGMSRPFYAGDLQPVYIGSTLALQHKYTGRLELEYIEVTELGNDENDDESFYSDLTTFKTATDNFFVNAFGDGGFKYSYNEESTGKIWLDGEIIYRRTFDVPTSPVADSLVSIPLGFSVGNFFKILDGGVQRSEAFSGDYVTLPFVDQRDGYNIQISSTPAKDTIVVNNGLLSEHVGGWITLEYTKA